MPNDGFTLMACVHELKKTILQGKVNKVTQPENDEIHLCIYAGGKSRKLLISASAESARLHLTASSKENPQVPPAFCMSLRKYLSGATLTDLRQNQMDRIVELEFEAMNDLFDRERLVLVCEIMGKYSNVILISQARKILAAMKSAPLDLQNSRKIFPGLTYAPPASQDKLYLLDREAIAARLVGTSGIVSKLIAGNVTGISSQLAEEIALHAGCPMSVADLDEGTATRIVDVLQAFYNRIQTDDYAPVTTEKDFMCFPYAAAAPLRCYPTINEAEDAFYDLREKHRHFFLRAKDLRQALKAAVKKSQNKLSAVMNEIDSSKDYDRFRLSGELITSHLYQIKKGDATLLTENYYEDPPCPVTIPLDKNLTPAQNAQKYFKRYAKLKRTYEINSQNLASIREHLDYLKSIENSFDFCSETSELNEIRRELEGCGVLKAKPVSKKKKTEPASMPLKFTFEGYDIYVGKNNLQNDALTKSASPTDLWLHALKEHGSHVVIACNGKRPPENVIAYAASLAAAFSSARNAGKTAVDYTLKKNVKKSPKSPPGMVTYTEQKTLIVIPANV